MSGFLGIGGGPSKETRTAWGNEQNVFNYALPLAKETAATSTATTAAGVGSMEGVKKYFQDIMSGSRPAQFAAIAPEMNAINAQSDASRSARAAFGTQRTGGTAGANMEADTARMTAANNALFAARPVAAEGAAKIGEAEANIGSQQFANGLRALGISEDAIQNLVQSTMQAKDMEMKNRLAYFQAIMGMASRAAGQAGGTP